ncbi:hypothetical protein [Bradyrhizobium erythrophlei]|uniref:Uncharacterized protein n=1 Tax=Bradyrhizobium erythrophlei TaxID=1437360 RepID=A0A1M5LWD3_9BRAD|nr:hypothetical protein [Bradyrhizobium erythrophlei]SHG69368.1 hypothetical protein SAMN05444169_3697 [Bradyrhizobium erythrophlei]
MPLHEFARAKLDEFYQAISPWESGYQTNSFTYVAVRQGADFVLVQGALWLNTVNSKIPYTHFESENVRGGHFHLSELEMDYRQLVDALISGNLNTPRGTLTFPVAGSGHHSVLYTPVHPSATQSQSRVNVVRIGGAEQTVQNQQPNLDWELRGASTPYDGLNDLLTEYGLGALFGDVISVEIIATTVMGIEESSTVSGTVASIGVRLASTLSTKSASVGYRVFSQGKVIARSILLGERMDWHSANGMQIGRAQIDVPLAAVVHCFANYDSNTQNHWWITDPTTAQNARRTVYQTFDDQLSVLQDFINKAAGRGRNARDLESGVAWLFWILGFSVAHLGGTDKTQDAADLIFVSPSGHFAVVECTTGLLRADNKLPLLISRAETVRKNLHASNQGHLKVLPVIITSRPLSEIRADIEQAEKLEVLVIAREALEEMITRTLVAPNADDLFARAERAIRDARERHDLSKVEN